jgi:ABC-type polysaccharide/polyol phosphate transport system ATPase subunit
MAVENPSAAPASSVASEGGPPAIRVEDLSKSFRIPTHRVDSLKERVLNPLAPREYRELRALDRVSFEIRQGEFFGIVGRNGSGKSTLLKLLASIYKADSGTIRVAGRLAPFIELGVGFNVELTARENVVLNGVMMGLTPGEARRRLDPVLEFAELEEFIDLKLKNYSSGMLVRLSFSLMLQADADVLLIDEVLAVGDASFQQKCADAFHRMKAEGKTIVLVTHDMSAVEGFCHRALLIGDGRVRAIGEPAEVASEYLQLNFPDQTVADHAPDGSGEAPEGVRLRDAWIENDAGERTTSIESGRPIRLRAEVEVTREAAGLAVGFMIANADGLGMFEFGGEMQAPAGGVAAGRRVTVSARVENPLAAGRYFVHCGVHRRRADGTTALLYTQNASDFVVFGGPGTRGVLSLDHSVEFDSDGGQGG